MSDEVQKDISITRTTNSRYLLTETYTDTSRPYENVHRHTVKTFCYDTVEQIAQHLKGIWGGA